MKVYQLRSLSHLNEAKWPHSVALLDRDPMTMARDSFKVTKKAREWLMDHASTPVIYYAEKVMYIPPETNRPGPIPGGIIEVDNPLLYGIKTTFRFVNDAELLMFTLLFRDDMWPEGYSVKTSYGLEWVN